MSNRYVALLLSLLFLLLAFFSFKEAYNETPIKPHETPIYEESMLR